MDWKEVKDCDLELRTHSHNGRPHGVSLRVGWEATESFGAGDGEGVFIATPEIPQLIKELQAIYEESLTPPPST